MRKVMQVVLLALALAALSCADQSVPDICGFYTGTRTAYYGTGGEMYLDIIRCTEDGISGETEFHLGTSQSVKSFEGSWTDDGDRVSLSFREIVLIEYSGTGDTALYSYSADVNGNSIAGEYYSAGRTYGVFSLKLTGPVAEE